MVPDSRVSAVRKPGAEHWKKTNITVADLEDDLEAIYKVDNSAKGRAEREQWRKNQVYVDTMLKQKHLLD